MFNNPNFARQVIMDHYEHPRNKGKNDTYRFKHMDSDSCTDDIYVYLKINDEDIIEDVLFEGVGCTIAIASTSMMTELIKNKTVEEARQLSNEYLKMIRLEDFDQDALKESVVFQNVGKQANRINCATLGWRGINLILNERELENE